MNVLQKATVKAFSHPSLRGFDRRLSRKLADSPIGYSFHLLAKYRREAARRSFGRAGARPIGETASQLRELGFAPKRSAYDPALIAEIRRAFEACIANDEISVTRANKGFQGTREISRQINRPMKNLPLLAELIDRETRDVLEQYYGAHFDLFRVVLWRNYHVTRDQRQGAEAYSNWWHFDQRPTDISKLFVNLNDVDEDCGPFHIISYPRSRELVRLGYRTRSDYGLPDSVMEDRAHMAKAVGPAGTGLFCNTELCLHRADIPAEGKWRDIVQFQFMPAERPLRPDWSKFVSD